MQIVMLLATVALRRQIANATNVTPVATFLKLDQAGHQTTIFSEASDTSAPAALDKLKDSFPDAGSFSDVVIFPQRRSFLEPVERSKSHLLPRTGGEAAEEEAAFGVGATLALAADVVEALTKLMSEDPEAKLGSAVW